MRRIRSRSGGGASGAGEAMAQWVAPRKKKARCARKSRPKTVRFHPSPNHAHDVSIGSQKIPRLRASGASGLSTTTSPPVVTHGPSSPILLIRPTTVLSEVHAALKPLPTTYLGPAQPYEAITFGAGLLRARAVCGRRPAILTLVASPDSGALGSLDEALIGVAAARMEPADDIFTAGIGVSLQGNTALVDLLGETLGVRYGALVEDTLVTALSASRLRLQSLIELVD